MHVRAVPSGGIAPRRLQSGPAQPDQRAEFASMIDRKIEHDAAADRAAHHDRLFELERLAEGADGLCIARGGELIFLAGPLRRWIRFAMPGHVEGDDAEILRKLPISEQMPPLPPVRACRVQAHQRNTGAILLEIDAMRLAADLDVDIAP